MLKGSFKNKVKQRGFTLVEVAIVVLLLTIITASKLRDQAFDLRISIAKAQGQQLSVLNEGLYTYGMRHFNAIVANTAVTGVAVTRAPTVAELVAIGDLTSGFSPNGYYGATYITSIVPAPAACIAPNCNIAGLVYLTQPINDPFTGTVDGPALGEAVTTIGADGGSSLRVPGTIQGANGGWTVPNPLGATRGILAARSGLGSQLDLTSYLKRDGSLPMSGNFDLGSNSMTNLATVVEGAACTSVGDLSRDASGALLTCQGGLQKRQGSTFWQDPVATLASLPACTAAIAGQTRIVQTSTVGGGPRAYTCKGATWQALAVDDAGNLTVGNNLTVGGRTTTGNMLINTVVTENAACAPNGLVSRDANGLLLSCQLGIWKKAQGSGLTFNGGSSISTVTTGFCSVGVGSCVATAVCPGGTAVKTGTCSGQGTGSVSVPGNSFPCNFSGGAGGVSGTATAFCG